MTIPPERKKHRSQIWALPTLFVGLVVMTIALAGCPLPQEPPYPDPGVAALYHDAYHYADYKDGVGDFVYIQLWNFSWLYDNETPLDASDDTYGVAAFGLANPEHLMGSQGLTNALGLIIRPGAQSYAINSPHYDPAVPGNFYASETFAPGPGNEMENPAGFIDVIDADTIRTAGEVTDGTTVVSWDLTYTRIPTLGGGWLPWVQWPLPYTVGLFPAWMTYYIHMPNALVTGTFTVNDGVEDTYELNGVKGYHDGFYGEAVFSDLEWDWFDYKQYNQPGYEDISVHMLHPHGPMYDCQGGWSPCTPGNLRVYYDGTEYNFTRRDDDIVITYLDFALDPEFGLQYPTEVNIHAWDTAGNDLDLTWTLAHYMRVYYDVPDPFADNVTYEILADFDGTFTPAGGDPVVILGNGFSDWGSPPFQ